MVCGRGEFSMKRFLTFLNVEGKISLRCPDGLIFGVGMPIGIMFLIAVIGGDQVTSDANITFIQSGFAALLTVGICATAFMGIPLTIASLRDKKILKHFFVTPASPVLLLLVQVIIAMITSIVSAIGVALIATFVFDYQMEGHVGWFIAAYFLVMFSMFSIGMLLASVCKTIKMANVATTFVYFPMVFLSGATIPFELFPEGVQKVSNVLPLTHGIRLLKDISIGNMGEGMWFSVILLVVFAIVGCILSIVLFKWE